MTFTEQQIRDFAETCKTRSEFHYSPQGRAAAKLGLYHEITADWPHVRPPAFQRTRAHTEPSEACLAVLAELGLDRVV